MADVTQANQSIWKNTLAAFRNQFTRLDKLLSDAKLCADNLADPASDMDAKEARKLVEPLKRKLELVNNYVTSLHSILPLAAADDDAVYSVDRITAQLNECMERAELGNLNLTAFLEAIEEAELHDVKESKPAAAGGGVRDTRAPEIKGVASALKPEELTSSIAAHDITIWVEQWNEYKENSAFSKLGEKSVIAYLKTCVSRDILSAIDYKNKKTEKEMLDAIRVYLSVKVHLDGVQHFLLCFLVFVVDRR